MPPFPASTDACWRVLTASIKGTSHEKTGQPCQDALCWRAWPDGLLAVALADGAGSAQYAETGATLAAQTALRRLAEERPAAWATASDDACRSLLADALKAAREAVLAEAGARQTRPRELATTLVLLLASPGWAAGAQIGDGAALIAGPSGEPRVLTRPWLSEHLNETTFLTSDTALDRPQIEIARTEVTQAVAFSDGLQMLALKLPEATPHPRFFGPLLRFAAAAADPAAGEAQLAAFLRSPRLTQRTDDDLTLLLATWAPGAPTAAPHPCASNVHPTGPS